MLHCAFHHKIHSFMILIADSGSTKTDWCYGTEISNCKIIQTEGINPFHQSAEKIESIICQGLIPQLGFPLKRCTAIYFYGAGCLPPKTESIIHVLQNNFPDADIAVDTDLLGAARALCKDNAGIACILGTGSNSCLYDGKQIIQNISPLGYILGDEGSGADLGRRLVADCLKEELSQPLRDRFFARFQLSREQILQAVYKEPFPNRFLASLSPFVAENLDEPEIRLLAVNAFTSFFRRNVLHYPQGETVHMVGSVAYYYRPVLLEVARSLSLTVGKILSAPVTELVKYHLNAAN